MGKRQLVVFLIAVLLFGLFSLVYSAQVIADLKMFYQDPRQALNTELVLRPQDDGVLTPTVNQIELATVQQAVEQRLENLYLAGTYKVVTQGEELIVKLPHSENIPYVASVISSVGEIEFIDGGTESPPIGRSIQTVTHANSQPDVYQTLFSGQDIEAAESPNSATGQIFYRLTLQPAAVDRLAAFIETQPNGYICMAVDGQVLNCSLMYHWSDNTIEILPGLSSGEILSLADLAIFLDSGPLSIPLTAEIR